VRMYTHRHTHMYDSNGKKKNDKRETQMCVCACVCVCVCMCMCVCVCVYAIYIHMLYTHIYIHTRLYVRLSVCVCVCAFVWGLTVLGPSVFTDAAIRMPESDFCSLPPSWSIVTMMLAPMGVSGHDICRPPHCCETARCSPKNVCACVLCAHQ